MTQYINNTQTYGRTIGVCQMLILLHTLTTAVPWENLYRKISNGELKHLHVRPLKLIFTLITSSIQFYFQHMEKRQSSAVN